MDTLKNEARESRPGILSKETRFDSYIGHTVINLSNTTLDQNQIKALEKGLTFCPTPGPPDKSQIWLDFKEFHRRLELVEFFNRDKKDIKDPIEDQSTIAFMNQNAQEDPNDSDPETAKNLEIQKNFKPKSGWRPYPPNRTLEIFQRLVKQEILKSKPKKTKHNNLTKQEMYEHKASVQRDGQITPVSLHFKSEGHTHKDMKFSVLEWCTPKFEASNTARRRRLELSWIFKIHCLAPIGINQFV